MLLQLQMVCKSSWSSCILISCLTLCVILPSSRQAIFCQEITKVVLHCSVFFAAKSFCGYTCNWECLCCHVYPSFLLVVTSLRSSALRNFTLTYFSKPVHYPPLFFFLLFKKKKKNQRGFAEIRIEILLQSKKIVGN